MANKQHYKQEVLFLMSLRGAAILDYEHIYGVPSSSQAGTPNSRGFLMWSQLGKTVSLSFPACTLVTKQTFWENHQMQVSCQISRPWVCVWTPERRLAFADNSENKAVAGGQIALWLRCSITAGHQSNPTMQHGFHPQVSVALITDDFVCVHDYILMSKCRSV